MKAVVIGAGKIGRGFIGQVLHEEGFELTFIDISKGLIDLLNQSGKYPVYLLGGIQKEYWVDKVKGYTIDDSMAIEALKDARIVTTSVGPDVLPRIAGFIAEGIKQRYINDNQTPLTVIACENVEYGTTVLYREVEKLLSKDELVYSNKYVGFPDAEVSRLAIPMEEGENDNPLAVKVEQYMEWIIDKNKLTDDLSGMKSLELTDNPTAYIKRKIYTLTGHAMLGYLGYEKGCKFIYEAAYDDGIFNTVYGALRECGRGWSMEYGMPEEAFNQYITIMLRRFSDTRLKDSVERVCYQPIRKLAKNERLIGPALTALKHDIMPKYILDGVLSALCYNSPRDEQAIELQRQIKENGIEEVLDNVCGISKENPLFKLILKEYQGRLIHG